jgi:hypothetical protein
VELILNKVNIANVLVLSLDGRGAERVKNRFHRNPPPLNPLPPVEGIIKRSPLSLKERDRVRDISEEIFYSGL